MKESSTCLKLDYVLDSSNYKYDKVARILNLRIFSYIIYDRKFNFCMEIRA